jgi:pimeloyl-ACP methyl ester carboxylesterase
VGVAGAPRAWDVEGPLDAPAIVFLHGSVLARQSWGPQVARLRDAYRCVTVDLPGHGSLAAVPFTLDGAADIAIEAIDEAAGGRAVLVGFSLGGYVAMAVAGRSPERVRGLVLAGASAEPSGVGAIPFHLFAFLLRAAPEGLVRRAQRSMFRRRYEPAIVAALESGGYWARGGAAGVRALPRGGFRSRLIAYGGPILVINGDLDLVFRLTEARFTGGLPRLIRRTLRRSSHLAGLDRPDQFSAEVRAFAESLEA